MKGKGVKQIRKYQKLSPPLPFTSVHSHLPSTKSSGKPAEAQAGAEGPCEGEEQPRSVNAQLLPLNVTDNTLKEMQRDSLLAVIKRELINIDPFYTLPCRLTSSRAPTIRRLSHGYHCPYTAKGWRKIGRKPRDGGKPKASKRPTSSSPVALAVVITISDSLRGFGQDRS
jgi:hypothetical protein